MHHKSWIEAGFSLSKKFLWNETVSKFSISSTQSLKSGSLSVSNGVSHLTPCDQTDWRTFRIRIVNGATIPSGSNKSTVLGQVGKQVHQL